VVSGVKGGGVPPTERRGTHRRWRGIGGGSDEGQRPQSGIRWRPMVAASKAGDLGLAAESRAGGGAWRTARGGGRAVAQWQVATTWRTEADDGQKFLN
jgi:hypothetical protein